MNKKLSPKYSDDVKISNIQYRKNVKDNSKVDINILLNRVKLQKTEIKKKIFTLFISTLLGICISAYLIFF